MSKLTGFIFTREFLFRHEWILQLVTCGSSVCLEGRHKALESPLDLSMFEHRTTTDKMGTLIQLYDLPALADRQHTEVPLFMVQLHTANVS